MRERRNDWEEEDIGGAMEREHQLKILYLSKFIPFL